MDPYTHYKSSRQPGSTRKSNKNGKSRGCRGYCSICHPKYDKRLTAKAYIAKDLEQEQEYLKSSPCYGHSRPRPASAYVDWFFSPYDEFEESAENETWERMGLEESLEWAMGKEVYESMLREHIEAEQQIERDKLASVSVGLEQIALQNREKDTVDEGWDVVSTGSVEFADWEEVIVE